jgi:hypothetical protein
MEDAKNLNPSLVPILQAMKDKFLKYWEEVPAVTIIANYLHLSFKKKYTILMLQTYKNNLHLPYTEEEARVSSLLEDMFNIYNSRRNINQASSSGQNTRYTQKNKFIYIIYYIVYSLVL